MNIDRLSKAFEPLRLRASGNERWQERMRPMGYLYKDVASRPEWLHAPQVSDVYSLSACVSADFAEYYADWQHNGYWLFDSPLAIARLAAEKGVSLDGLKLFYYEAYEQEFDGDTTTWRPFGPHPRIDLAVVIPEHKHLEGFDVTQFTCLTSPECSPLSCNSFARSMPTNQHCLFDTFAQARRALHTGKFHECGDGPYRIIAVYSVPAESEGIEHA